MDNLTAVYGGRLQGDSLKEMAGILSAIRRKRGIAVEDLCGETGMSYSRLSSLVSMLEADGFITIDLLRRCSISRRSM
ncbi:MAG: winged helix-turn-helix domain-containing protein [Paludibacteraceae bacterium]|nr:winged helix-turn-helix domain-containing protein [Paludibacteraceae bacterium]